MVRKNVKSGATPPMNVPSFEVVGSRRYVSTSHVSAFAQLITKITANPIPIAELSFWDTPKNGHNPKNRVNTKFCMNIEKIIIINNILRSITASDYFHLRKYQL
jgi:hypothetical protein